MSKFIKTLRRWLRKLAVPFLLLFFIFCFIVAYFFNEIFISVPPGHVGAKWERFNGGINVENTYLEGFHLNWPWDILRVFDTRLLVESKDIDVLSKDGLRIDLSVSVRYRLNGNKAAVLYKHVRPDFAKIVLLPEVQSHSRIEFSRYTSEEIYSLSRERIQQDILTAVVQGIELKHSEDHDQSEPYIYVQDILIKSISLPETVRKSIEQKIAQKHLMLSYEFRLKREKLESQRKSIEALGIQNFQNTVRKGISDQYLRWKGIDATLALAKSNNSKVVVIGAGDEGLPLILGNMGDHASSQQPESDSPPSSEQDLKQRMDNITDNPLNESLFNGTHIEVNPGLNPIEPTSAITDQPHSSK